MHPAWTTDDVLAFYQLAPTAFILELATRAGFRTNANGECNEMNIDSHPVPLGENIVEYIATATGLPLDFIQPQLGPIPSGFGEGEYGKTSYGYCRSYSDGGKPVQRKVTSKGQLSYRKHLYTLGKTYSGQIATIIEQGQILAVSFENSPPLTLGRHAC